MSIKGILHGFADRLKELAKEADDASVVTDPYWISVTLNKLVEEFAQRNEGVTVLPAKADAPSEGDNHVE